MTNAQMSALHERAEHYLDEHYEAGSPFPMVTNARMVMASEMASFAAKEIMAVVEKERP